MEPDGLQHQEERHRLVKDAMHEVMGETAEARKALVKAAIKEWLEEKYAQVGVWTLRAIAAAAVAALAYFVLWERGWKPPGH